MARVLRYTIVVTKLSADVIGRPVVVERMSPGGDNLPDEPLAGRWVDVVSASGQILYSKVLDVVPDGTQESFDDDHTPFRVADPDPVRRYVVFIPDDRTPGRRLVLKSSIPGTDDPVAEPILDIAITGG
jgi:hypothetical protein